LLFEMQNYLFNFYIQFFFNISFAINNMANPFNLSCNIVDLRYDFINFNFEKLHSTEAIVTNFFFSKKKKNCH
jgi:hypothetical protein